MVNRMSRKAALVLFVLVGCALAVQPGIAKMKVRVNFDKEFDFKTVTTWAWSQQVGDVMVARTQQDDPVAIRARIEPIVKSEVEGLLPRRGVQVATGAPDVTLTYYLLLTVGSSTQEMGQFLPSVLAWGLPPFAPATTSYEMVEQGALVLDFRANDRVVWRGIAEANIRMDADVQKREGLLREAAQELIKKFPPR